jgi:predicted metal-dependent phosphoesterase TrpH
VSGPGGSARSFAESSGRWLGGAPPGRSEGEPRFFADLHSHSNASFDSLASPASLVRTAAARGLTHLAITDHDRVDGALAARDLAVSIAPELTVIVGSEVRTADGDLICLFLEGPIPVGLPAEEAIAVARAQGGLVGIPHPFDRFRGSLMRDARLERLAGAVDWIETHNARVALGGGNQRAAEFAHERGLPGIAVSDAHSAFEVGVSYTAFDRDPSTPEGLLAALRDPELIPGRASFSIRLVTPIAKAIQRARGNGRIRPSGPSGDGAPAAVR